LSMTQSSEQARLSETGKWKTLPKRLEEIGTCVILPSISIPTFIYFKLSIFQRHHAQKRVIPRLRSRNETERVDAEANEENPASDVRATPCPGSVVLRSAS